MIVKKPWGTYEVLLDEPNYKVKRIVVHPYERFSLQYHKHREEHWVVVEGKAKITIDKETLVLNKGQSVFVPLGAKHRLENPYESPVLLIEVQIGSYFGEDDIIRYDDLYLRNL